jgi:hypothetical protein
MSRKTFGCLVLLVLTAACGIGTGSAPAITPSRSPSAGTQASLECRLPVVSMTTSAAEPPGGWITFPTGVFARDPESLNGRLAEHIPSYDRQFLRWVPVEYQNLSPDGTSYILHNDASLPKHNDFYVVDVRTGTRRFVLSGDGPPQAPASWTVITYATEGVYLWSSGMLTIPGLWLLDPTQGTVRLIDGSHYWGTVANGAAWALDPPFGGTTDAYRIFRLDLTSGVVARWYEGSTPIGLLSPTPDGDVLVSYGKNGSGRLELLSSPDHLAPLEVPLNFPQIYSAFLTHPGVWLPFPQNGLALYEKGQGVRIMTRSIPVSDVAGGCF